MRFLLFSVYQTREALLLCWIRNKCRSPFPRLLLLRIVSYRTALSYFLQYAVQSFASHPLFFLLVVVDHLSSLLCTVALRFVVSGAFFLLWFFFFALSVCNMLLVCYMKCDMSHTLALLSTVHDQASSLFFFELARTLNLISPVTTDLHVIVSPYKQAHTPRKMLVYSMLSFSLSFHSALFHIFQLCKVLHRLSRSRRQWLTSFFPLFAVVCSADPLGFLSIAAPHLWCV